MYGLILLVAIVVSFVAGAATAALAANSRIDKLEEESEFGAELRRRYPD